MAVIRSEVLFATLKAQRHLPYTYFPDRRRAAVGDVLRVFDLRPGDSFALAAHDQPVYVSVLDGIVGVIVRDASALKSAGAKPDRSCRMMRSFVPTGKVSVS